MIKERQFLENLDVVRGQISKACQRSGRKPSEVQLLPVTKNCPSIAVELCKSADFLSVGENRVQEALSKQKNVDGIRWELIGHLQSNKAKQSLHSFDRIQTIDSIRLIQKLHAVCEQENKSISVLLQVNAGNDPAKYGFSIDEAARGLDAILTSEYLKIDGLMTIAPYAPNNLNVARKCFEELASLRSTLEQSHRVLLPELSMGMSGDLCEAIAAGSTIVRVGSALFGQRAG